MGNSGVAKVSARGCRSRRPVPSAIGPIVQVLSRSTDELVAGVAEVVERYLPSLRALRAYDEGEIELGDGITPTRALAYDEARTVIDGVGAEFPADVLFGAERGGSLRSVKRPDTRASAGSSSTRRCRRRLPTFSTSTSKTIRSPTATSAARPPCSCISWPATTPSTMPTACRESRTTRLPRSL